MRSLRYQWLARKAEPLRARALPSQSDGGRQASTSSSERAPSSAPPRHDPGRASGLWSVPAPGRLSSPALVLYTAALGCGIFAYLFVRASFGLKYPPPWPDEASFLWQAIAIQQENTLFAPELNPERHVLWMPPGYMVLSGVLFKVFGFSLSFARLLSALYVCAAISTLAALVWPWRARVGHLLLCIVYLHSPILLLAGNTARMEPLVALIGTGGFLLLAKNRPYWAGSVLTLAPLVHPNGLFFTVFGLGAVAVTLKSDWRRPTVAESAAMGATALCWIGYGVYAAFHLSELIADIGGQLAWKQLESSAEGGFFGRLASVPNLVAALLLTGALAYARKFRKDTSIIVTLGFCLLVVNIASVGWMYEVYSALLFLVTSVLVLELLVDALERFGKLKETRLFGAGLALSLASALFSWHYITKARFMTESIEVSTASRHPLEPAYFTPADHEAITNFLHMMNRASSHPLTVQFVPSADALFFHELRNDSLGFIQATKVTGIADVYVFHDSIWVPKTVRDLHRMRLMVQQSIPMPLENWPVVHHRETEVWRVYRR